MLRNTGGISKIYSIDVGKKSICWVTNLSSVLSLLLLSINISADDNLAAQLTNPVADLISVPIQANYDSNIGSASGSRYLTNVQPVLPMTLNDEWNIISRTIVPIIDQHDVAGPSGSQSGVGDIVQSLFFSPKLPSPQGWILGVGPAVLIPTASDKLLGTEKWAVGPTAVALKMDRGWTYGALVNHLWDVAGDSQRNDVNATFLQPFVSYTQKRWTYSVSSEATYDWDSKQAAIPINLLIAKLVTVGVLPISFGVGARYWAQSTDTGPNGWGARLTMTFVFPK